MKKNSKKTKRTYTSILGAVFIGLAVIGLITVMASGWTATQKILDNESQKEKFEQVILPVMMFDPVPFDEASALDALTVLKASLWRAIDEKKNTYSYDDMGNMIVPQSDVDVSAKILFGEDVTLKHQSFSEGLVMRYSYDEEKLLYLVPIGAQTGYYVPEISDISKKGDRYFLNVGYLPPGDGWAMSVVGETSKPQADKHMIYEIKEVENGYQLMSIKEDPAYQIPTDAYIPENNQEERVVATEIPIKEEKKINNG